MKKIILFIMRIAVIIGMFFTMSLTLSSSISMQVSTKGIVEEAINKTANEYGLGNVVKSSWGILNTLGIEDQIFDQLPKKLKINTSYLNLYNLTNDYQKNGKISASQLGMPYDTNQQKTIGDLVTNYLNDTLEQNKKEINQGISYYKIIFYTIVGLYLVAMIFVLFGKRFGVIPFLLSSLGGYALIAFTTTQLQTEAQAEIYKGITVTMANGFNTSAVLALIIAIIWYWIASIEKRNKKKQKRQKKQIKEQYEGKHAAS